MMTIDQLLSAISTLQRQDLERWISDELVTPQSEADSLLFSDIECARIRLICTLTYELDIDSGTLPVVLSLLDQLYDTRRRLLLLSRAVAGQDKTIRTAVIEAISGGNSSRDGGPVE
jgi:chaperone modulatory protein CbpM